MRVKLEENPRNALFAKQLLRASQREHFRTLHVELEEEDGFTRLNLGVERSAAHNRRRRTKSSGISETVKAPANIRSGCERYAALLIR